MKLEYIGSKCTDANILAELAIVHAVSYLDAVSHHDAVSHPGAVSHPDTVSRSAYRKRLYTTQYPCDTHQRNNLQATVGSAYANFQNSAKSFLPFVSPVQPTIRKSIKVVSRPIGRAESSGGLHFIIAQPLVAPHAKTSPIFRFSEFRQFLTTCLYITTTVRRFVRGAP